MCTIQFHWYIDLAILWNVLNIKILLHGSWKSWTCDNADTPPCG